MLKIIHLLTLLKKLMIKIVNFKLVTMLEYQNTKTFLLKAIPQIGPKEVFVIEKVKNTVPWTYIITDHIGREKYWDF